VPHLARAAAALLAAAALAAAQPPAAAPGPAYPDDLAVGPFEATFTPAFDPAATAEKNARRKVEVQFVTRQKVVIREKGQLAVHDARKVLSVTGLKADGAEDAKRVWQFDKAAGVMTGPVAPRPPIVVSPRPMTGREMTVYLLLRAEYLHRSLNDAIQAGGKEKRAALLEYARQVGDVGAREKLPRPVLDLFDLSGYAARQSQLLADLAAAARETEKAELDRVQLRELAAREAATRQQAGALAVILGGAGAYGAETEQGARLGLRVADAGVGEINDAVRDYRSRVASIERVQGVLKGQALDRFNRARAGYDAGRDGLAGRLDAAAAAVGVDKGVFVRLEKLADDLFQKKDVRGAISVLTRRAELVARTGRPNPLLLVDAARLEAGLLASYGGSPADRAKRSDELFALARRVAAGVDDVPPGAVFDRDRVAVLSAAAAITHQAVTLRHGFLNWSACWDPRADFGVQLADRALGYGVELDPAGEVRALRAWLLFQRGLTDEAARQGAEVAALRAGDAVTQYNLARVYGRAERTAAKATETFDCLDRAIKAGFYDLAAAAADTDIRGTTVTNADRWKDLTAPKVEATMEAVQDKGGGFKFNMWVTNKSAFPLKDVTLRYTPSLGSDRTKVWRDGAERTEKVAAIPPGGRHLWSDAAATPPGVQLNRDKRVTVTGPFLAPSLRPAAFPVAQGEVTFTRPQFFFGLSPGLGSP
jgi:hypothetical protein